MVSGFEWTAIGLMVFGMVIPFWVMTILTCIVLYQQKRFTEPPSRPIVVHDYAKLMRALMKLVSEPGRDGKFNGPSMIAYLNELRAYPQYRKPTLLFLEEVTITGSGKFDEVCKVELESLETHLLGLEDE